MIATELDFFFVVKQKLVLDLKVQRRSWRSASRMKEAKAKASAQ